MANPTYSDIKYDIGDLWNDIEGTTTTTVNALISKSQSMIKEITGTTAGYDLQIRNLANAYVCQHVLGSRNYQNISIEGLSVGQKEILNMRDQFLLWVENGLRLKGYTLTGKHIIFEVVNL